MKFYNFKEYNMSGQMLSSETSKNIKYKFSIVDIEIE